MDSNPSVRPLARWIYLAILCLPSAPLSAEQFGLFTYEVLGASVEITFYPRDAVGDVSIPAQLEGLPVTSIGVSAFSGCTALTSVTIPDSVTSIGSAAFSHSGLTSLTIPGSVTSIGVGSFSECTSLASISIGVGLSTIPHSAFRTCVSLTRLTIPGNVTSIAPGAFSECTGLTSVSLGNGLSSIGDSAFRTCSSLSRVTIPAQVTSIGSGAFFNCGSLSRAVFLGSASAGSFSTSMFNLTAPAFTVYYLSGSAGFTSPTWRGYPSMMIDEAVFPAASWRLLNGFPYDCIGLTDVTIPESTTHIPDSAFAGCNTLVSVTIPVNVATIGLTAFNNCSRLRSIVVAPENPRFASENGVLFNAPRTTLIRYPEGKTGTYTIPQTVRDIIGMTCAEEVCDGAGAFQNCHALTGVIIPPNVTGIGHRAFSGSSGLTTAFFLGNADSRISSNAFENTAGDFTIYFLSGRTGFTVPTWNGYSSVMVDEAGEPAAYWRLIHGFPYDCSSLTNITIPPDVTEIVDDAFSHCTRLTSITLPEGVISIGKRAFLGCSSLESVCIPASVTRMGNRAFAGCSELRAIHFLGDAPNLFGNSNFTGVAPNFTIYYLSSANGFSSPTFRSHPTVMIADGQEPVSSWLIDHGLPDDADLLADLNDGVVSLRMAYALDLDPRQNLQNRLPVPVLDGNALSLTFFAARPDLTYTVQTSTDLKTWTTEGVTTSDLGPDGMRTATIPRDAPQRFLRLVVE